MQMPGRKYTAPSSSYRYGFNGKENDNEVKGEGNQQDYGMRIYDPRLGRFLSVDPLVNKYPSSTPYGFAGANPILLIDKDGKFPFPGIILDPLKVLAFIAKVSNKTITASIGLQVSGGLGYVSGVYKRNAGIAVDPMGNFGLTTTYNGFVDLFSFAGGNVYNFFADVENKGLKDIKQFDAYLGFNFGLSGSVGYFDFDDIQKVSGLIRETSIDVTFPVVGGGVTVYSSDDDGQYKGASLSFGIKGPPAFGIGSNITNTKLFAFRIEDISDASKVLFEANSIVFDYRQKPGHRGNTITYRYYEIQSEGFTESWLEISANENGNSKTLFNKRLGEHRKMSENYYETRRVSENRPETNQTDAEKQKGGR
jgi:RHS repeat-associated protein